jgi:hypothetical protein
MWVPGSTHSPLNVGRMLSVAVTTMSLPRTALSADSTGVIGTPTRSAISSA